jgi:hypothetical protein
MVKLLVVAFVFLAAIYYVDIIIRIGKDERAGKVRYKGLKLVIPFAYWLAPYKEKKRKVKPKKIKKNEAK